MFIINRGCKTLLIRLIIGYLPQVTSRSDQRLLPTLLDISSYWHFFSHAAWSANCQYTVSSCHLHIDKYSSKIDISCLNQQLWYTQITVNSFTIYMAIYIYTCNISQFMSIFGTDNSFPNSCLPLSSFSSSGLNSTM